MKYVCLLFAALAVQLLRGSLPDYPECVAFPHKTTVTAAGSYAASDIGRDFVLTGTISGTITITATEVCQVTLRNLSLTGSLTIKGDAILRLEGTSALGNDGKNVLTADGSLILCGTGSATLTGGGAKKANAVLYVTDSLRVTSGTLGIEMTYAEAEKGFGIWVKKTYSQSAGNVRIASACTDYKDTGLYTDKKDITLAGGTLSIAVQGPKSVALTADAADATTTLSGGALILSVGGAAAKGVKGDGAFVMSGGILNATVTGDPLYEAYTTDDGSTCTVTVASSTLVTKGTYLVEDVSVAAAVKCDSVSISGGTVRVVASGVASRGIVADTTLNLTGGLFDIQANGTASNPVIELEDESDLTVTALDRKTAACIKQGDTNGTAHITGGVFYLVTTNYGGKCMAIDGTLTIGTEGQATLPTDDSFAPDIQCSSFGEKLFVAAKKLSAYTTLGTATPVADASSAIQLSSNASRVTSGSGDDVDYTNPKAVRVESGLTFHGGRMRVYSKCDGGEGMESKTYLTFNGGVFEGTTYDDCIQASDAITINGGYLYCGSTGNDALDSNGTLTINGGVVLAFTTTTPEVGIDVDAASNLKINGGVVMSLGSATEMAYGSSGSQSSYLKTSVSASTYAGKYVKIAGSTATVRIPSMSSTGGTISIMCSAPSCTSSAPSTSSSAPTSGDTGFHGVYIQ